MKQKHLLKSLLLLIALVAGGSAWAGDYTDVLTASLFQATSTTYTDFTGVSVSNGSSAVYAGNNAKTTSGGIQLRSKNSNSGIVSTTSGGNRVKSVSITVESGSNTLDIYGSNTAYSSASDLYDSSKQGTKVGSLNANGTVTISGDYKYIGLRSNNGAIYLTDVTIVWEAGSSVPTCSLPSFTPAAGSYISAQNVTISTTTEGATIYYTTDGIDPTTSSSIYSSAIPVNETTTIKAIAAKTGYNNSAVATATYTIVSFEHAGTQNDPYTVADARAAIDVNSGVTDVYATGIVSKIVTEYSTQYSNITFDISADGLTTSAQLRAYRCTDESNVDASDVRVGDEVVIKGNLTKYGETYEFAQGCLLISLQHPDVPAVPTINAENVSIAYDATSGEIEYEIENPVDGESLTPTTTADWISNITVGDDAVTFTATANDGNQDRTATITLSYEGAEDVVVTVTQGHLISEFAELPFEYDGNGQGDLPDGFTVEGVSSYNSSPKMKFDTAGDYAILAFNETPGKLTFDIKGNPGSGTSIDGTFKVQTSADGVNYTDLETYTELGSTLQSEEFDLAETVRYIKWIYTEKTSGNVALGNITLAKPEAPSTDPVITVAETSIEVDAAEADGTIDLTYHNIVITEMTDFDIQFYDAEGEEVSEPDWIEVLVAEQDPQVGEGYVVSFYMLANEGEARTAYFKVFALGDEDYVYSDLVTVTQAAYVAPATGDEYALFTGDLVEGDYVIYYNGYAMNTTVSNNRLQYAEVTLVNDVITTDNAAIVWHIAPSGEYWTLYNADAQAYAAGTGTKNQAKMIDDGTDDKALWTVSGNETYEFVNKANAAGEVNANLRNNGTYGFACYSTSTGGALSLYKKVSAAEETITISAAGYATYCSENALDFSNSGLTAYVAILNENNVTFSPVETVPANTGVLLKGNSGDYTINVVEGGAVGAMQNLFQGVLVDTEVDAPIFVLMNGDAGVGFYMTKQTFTVGAHTAYLPATAGSSRSFIAIDEATAIEDIAAETMTNGEVYNLQGQRVVKAQKGLYIINGKKVVIK